MSWECLSCGQKNVKDVFECVKCELDKETAISIAITKKKTMCDECHHRHKDGVFCHVFVEADEDDDGEDFVEESEEEESSDDSDEDDLDLGINTRTTNVKQVATKSLSTPPEVRKMGYIRCNCNKGVPSDSRLFEPVPMVVYVGELQIQTYLEIMDVSQKKFFFSQLQNRLNQPHEVRRRKQKPVMIANNLPEILSYLPFGECSPTPVVCRNWKKGTEMYQPYLDMRNCFPWQVFRPHLNQVDSVLVRGEKLYTGGDKKVLVSNFHTGEVLGLVTRDSGQISNLQEKDRELYCSSSNGSTRTYGLTHTGKNIYMLATMWEHTRTIKELMFALPSHGPCAMHGIDAHICAMYTASEDRTIRMWNMNKFICMKAIGSKALRTATFMSIAQSERHLFGGTSTSSVAVFNKLPICERDDIHGCNVSGADKSYCLQVTLQIPEVTLASGAPASVTALLCAGINFTHSELWAGDSSGQLTIWQVPDNGLDFIPVQSTKVHWGAINAMKCTWRHAITASDDGFVIIHDLALFTRIRSINLIEWGWRPDGSSLFERPDIPRRLKSMHLEENYETGGSLAIGTSYGDVVILSLGTTV